MVHLIVDPSAKEKDKSGRLAATEALLKTLPSRKGCHLASPEALSSLTSHQDYGKAAEAAPRVRKLEPYLLDTWSATGLESPAGHQVAPWLQGITEEDYPEVWLVWRRWLPPADQAQKWVEAYPVATRERSNLPIFTARKFVEELVKGLSPQAHGREGDHFRAILVTLDRSGEG